MMHLTHKQTASNCRYSNTSLVPTLGPRPAHVPSLPCQLSAAYTGCPSPAGVAAPQRRSHIVQYQYAANPAPR